MAISFQIAVPPALQGLERIQFLDFFRAAKEFCDGDVTIANIHGEPTVIAIFASYKVPVVFRELQLRAAIRFRQPCPGKVMPIDVH